MRAEVVGVLGLEGPAAGDLGDLAHRLGVGRHGDDRAVGAPIVAPRVPSATV